MSQPLTPEDRHDIRSPSNLTVSPDGTRVAFLVREADRDEDEYRTSLFVAPVDGHRPPHRLTRVANASSPEWGPTGNRLAFLAEREQDVALAVGRDSDDEDVDDDTEDEGETDGGEEPESQVWVFDLSLGGDPRQITNFDDGVGDFDWSPDGDRFVVSARDPTDEQQSYLDGVREENAPYEVTRLQYKQDGKGYLDDVVSYLFVVDGDAEGATRDGTRRLDDAYGRGAFEPYAGLQPAWGPNGHIAYTSFYGDNPEKTFALDVHTIAPDGSNRQTLTDGEETALALRWSPDGRYLSFAARHPENFHRPVEVHVAEPDERSVSPVSASLDRTLSLAGVAEWIGDDTLLCPIGDQGRTRLARLNARDDDPEYLYTPDEGEIAGVDATAETTAIVRTHPNEGVDVFAIPTADLDSDSTFTQLSALNDELLADKLLPTCEELWFENSDGDEIHGLLHLPAAFDLEDDSEPLPLICLIHGGPTSYDAPGFNFDYAYWTGQGYAILNVNYRGSTSFGQEFSESIRGEWGPREADDILSGVDHVVQRGWADPDRLFISGISQGGINTLYVVTRDDRFVAAAPEHGIYDFYSGFGTTDMHQWYVNDVGVPWENEEAYREMSSIPDVSKINTPLLIAAGEDDARTPPSQAEQLYVSAKRVGIESKLVIYQDEHHSLSRPKRVNHRLESLTEWFENHDPQVDTDETTS